MFASLSRCPRPYADPATAAPRRLKNKLLSGVMSRERDTCICFRRRLFPQLARLADLIPPNDFAISHVFLINFKALINMCVHT